MTDPRETPVVVTDLRDTVALLRGLLERATPGPWKTEDGAGDLSITAPDGDDEPWLIGWAAACCGNSGEPNWQTPANAALIVAAINALPALLDAADRDGLVLTKAMLDAGRFAYKDGVVGKRGISCDDVHRIWSAMIAASPQLPADKGEGR